MQTDLRPTPLLRLHATHRDTSPLICVPGAGASVTAFVDFVGCLGDSWPVYGLQPRGLDISESPHESIEESAAYNLEAIADISAIRPIHLLGHSHGGLVAYEMAVRLHEQGRNPLSLTLVDSEPPNIADRDGREEFPNVFREFVAALEGNYGKPLFVEECILQQGRSDRFLDELHEALVRANCISSRTTSRVLQGSFATFAAAIRSFYIPTSPYPGRLDLILASSRSNSAISFTSPVDVSRQWGAFATSLDLLVAPGDHYSMLRAPHVDAIAKWWRKKRTERTRADKPL